MIRCKRNNNKIIINHNNNVFYFNGEYYHIPMGIYNNTDHLIKTLKKEHPHLNIDLFDKKKENTNEKQNNG